MVFFFLSRMRLGVQYEWRGLIQVRVWGVLVTLLHACTLASCSYFATSMTQLLPKKKNGLKSEWLKKWLWTSYKGSHYGSQDTFLGVRSIKRNGAYFWADIVTIVLYDSFATWIRGRDSRQRESRGWLQHIPATYLHFKGLKCGILFSPQADQGPVKNSGV